MPITPNAQRNHDELFPDHRSALKATDPELVEIFDNWAFGEVIEDAPLDVRLRLMVQLAALIASHAVAEYRVMLGAALQVGVTPVQIKEVVYQAVPYAGMARAFEFLHATNEVLTSRDIELPLPGQSTTTPETRQARGLEVQRQLLGEGIDQMYAQSYQQTLGEASSKGQLDKTSANAKRVQAIANRLIAQAPTFRADAAQWKWEVNLIKSDEMNANCG